MDIFSLYNRWLEECDSILIIRTRCRFGIKCKTRCWNTSEEVWSQDLCLHMASLSHKDIMNVQTYLFHNRSAFHNIKCPVFPAFFLFQPYIVYIVKLLKPGLPSAIVNNIWRPPEQICRPSSPLYLAAQRNMYDKFSESGWKHIVASRKPWFGRVQMLFGHCFRIFYISITSDK